MIFKTEDCLFITLVFAIAAGLFGTYGAFYMAGALAFCSLAMLGTTLIKYLAEL